MVLFHRHWHKVTVGLDSVQMNEFEGCDQMGRFSEASANPGNAL